MPVNLGSCTGRSRHSGHSGAHNERTLRSRGRADAPPLFRSVTPGGSISIRRVLFPFVPLRSREGAAVALAGDGE